MLLVSGYLFANTFHTPLFLPVLGSDGIGKLLG